MHRSEPHLYSITSMAQASMGATLLRYQCPRPVRVPPKWVSAICSIYRCIPGGAAPRPAPPFRGLWRIAP